MVGFKVSRSKARGLIWVAEGHYNIGGLGGGVRALGLGFRVRGGIVDDKVSFLHLL